MSRQHAAPRIFASFFRAAPFVAAALIAAACAESPTGPAAGDPNAVAQVQVAALDSVVQAGSSLVFRATARTADGRALAGRPVTWTSSDPRVAQVSAEGAVTALREGTAWIRATVGGREGQARLRVTPAPPANPVVALLVDTSATLMEPGTTTRRRTMVRYQDGTLVEGYPAAWTSSDPRVATVGHDGTIAAHAGGEATLRVSAGEFSAELRLTVTEWVRYPLGGVDGAVLPFVVADSSWRTEQGARVHRVTRLVAGEMRFSTLSMRYEQEFTLRVSETSYYRFDGQDVPGPTLVRETVVRDHGEAGWAPHGGRRFASAAVQGLVFDGQWEPGRELTTFQPVGGSGGWHTLHFAR